jgi:uncharacterized protein (TIGR02588 family)
MAAKGKTSKDRAGGTPLLEWISAAIGAAIAITLLAFIAAEAVRSVPEAPPVLEVRPTALKGRQGLYIVEVTVANRSGQTAAAVNIEGELRQGGTSVEKSSATLSYVPGFSEREAGLIFSRDPRQFQLQVRATGYEKP